MESRDKARTDASQTNDPELWKSYRKLRNIVTTEIKKNRKNYYKTIYQDCEEQNDTGKLYKTIKSQLGWNNSGPPTVLTKDGVTSTAPSRIAQAQMDHFTRKNEKLLRKVQSVQEEIDPLEVLRHNFDKWKEGKDQLPKLELKEITPATTARLISKLKNSSATGWDELEPTVIKLAAVPLLQPITYLINLTISTQVFPNKWKIGRVLPLYKGNNLPKSDPNSYRPITLLPTVSKLAERAIQEQLMEFMNTNNFLHPNHHSYRKGHSTTSALIQLSDQLFEAADCKDIGVAVSIDQSSAFDCLCPEILEKKLKLYGAGDSLIKWIQSYLSFRSHFVEIGTKKSQ